MSNNSASIVSFVGKLHPVYFEEHLEGGGIGARCLVDGTLILQGEADDPEGWVRVQWQGDPAKVTVALGEHIATLAVARYALMHGLRSDAHRKEIYEHLAQHFECKTGCNLMLEEPASFSERLRAIFTI